MASAKAKRARRVAALTILVMLVAGAAGWWATRGTARSGASGGVRVPLVGRTVRAPEGVRVRVEVINATTTRGLARRAMRQLRDAGFDVVDMGTAPASARRDTTLVLSRSGHDDWAELVAELLGEARVESRPDSSRYLDVTVFLGTTYRPPAETLYP
jgi:hypothetical protein